MDSLVKAGGAARWKRLREFGVSERSLKAALASGAVLRAGQGGYALPDAPAALALAVSLQGVASHVSAAVLHGLAVWTEPVATDVIVPRGTRRGAQGVRVHHADLGPADVDPSRDVTSVLRTLLDCGRTLPLAEAVVILDSALRARLVTLHRLQQAAIAARGPGAAALRRAVRHVDPRAGSPLESALRVLMSVLDVDIQSQVRMPGVGTVDFVLDGWLVVEGDGFEFHSDRTSYRDDRRRSNGLAERGYVLLRFTWEDVRLRPHWVLARVERVLAQRPAVIPPQPTATDAS